MLAALGAGGVLGGAAGALVCVPARVTAGLRWLAARLAAALWQTAGLWAEHSLPLPPPGCHTAFPLSTFPPLRPAGPAWAGS